MVDTVSVEAWFQERPKWMQDAARRLVESRSLTDEDFVALLAICKSEADDQTVTFSGLPPNVLSVTDTQKPVRLNAISNVQGVNALNPSRPLEFGDPPLRIVYGRNGAGKSGYVRLLKHACGARRPGKIHPNVYLGDAPQQSAEFAFTESGLKKQATWSGSPIGDLVGVEIYDTNCGLAYVDEENEVSYEPWLLRLFTKLTDACKEMSKRLDDEKGELVSCKPLFPPEYGETKAAKWYTDIQSTTEDQIIAENTKWNRDDESRLNDIAKRLAEANPTRRAAALRGQRDLLLRHVTDLKNSHSALSDTQRDEYRKLRNDATLKRKAADEDAGKVFDQAPLDGIGSGTWRLLWEQARIYSEEVAYKDQPFPNVKPGARCVLCQQELDEESQDRFASFESFVKGELQRLAEEAEESLEEARKAVQNSDVATTSMDSIEVVDADAVRLVTDLVGALRKRCEQILGEEPCPAISPLPSKKALIALVVAARRLGNQARSLDADARDQNRDALERERKELAARKWLNQQEGAIKDEIARLVTIQRLGQAKRQTNTSALSTRKGALVKELITEAYIARFKAELQALGASNIKIELKKTHTDVGKVYHRICLKNSDVKTKVSDILSEGEFRIVSFAAFLADTEGREANTPFVFDDPISSLDHVFEEASARRLAKLAETRQVIVFTHRLSLVGLLEKYAKGCGIKTSTICLSKYTTGDIAELPIDLKKTDKSVNFLLNERLTAARGALEQGDAVYEEKAKSLCRDIRVLLERIVEKNLVNEVVCRFSPEIQTKGKIGALAKITEEDCRFIDDYMTKYSRDKHSQPEETPFAFPKPDEIEDDLKKIRVFITTLKDRNK